MIKKYVLVVLGFFLYLLNVQLGCAETQYSVDENNTIQIFKQASPKVVYVHRLNHFRPNFAEEREVNSGSGSGILWDKDGHIVTNYHVVRGADKVMVSFGDKSFSTKIIGVEPRKDIAVLKLESVDDFSLLKNFEPFKTVEANTLVVGQKTLAIGNPFGLDHTLTAGIISALEREVPGIGGVHIKNMIQTDASINPGNSGGPLLDNQGRLIGLNTMIYSSSGSSAGVGFAVPAETIARIVPQLIQYGRVKMAGIGLVPLGDQVSHYFRHSPGVYIADVLPHSPASDAGLRGVVTDSYGRLILGDMLTTVNGKTISNYNDLYNAFVDIPIGTKVNVTIDRGGIEKKLTLKTIDISEVM